ncbi:hypothetical protein PYW08_000357 [Mythimna loreyi]|uniref:Uncharacterized protein n=1 Tax=Mythimna loreyi TaxID=667449 RepID=A0ACC2RC97_9NEOP|nr:hypothetical protein PYW08_000357 [Mythimna loreyi]
MWSTYYFNVLFAANIFSFIQVIDSLRIVRTTTPLPNGSDPITSFDSHTYCKFQPNKFSCSRKRDFSYFYNVEKNTCEPFDYGHCLHPYNMFHTLHACTEECRDMNLYRTRTNVTPNIFCRFQPEYGSCNSYFPRFYYDMYELTCRGFSYSGCGGNQNRFEHNTVCMDVCHDMVNPCNENECFH